MFSEEDFEPHSCEIPFSGVKIIEVAYFRDDSQNGKERITGRGIDGVLYSFEVVPRKSIPLTIPLTDEKKRRFGTDEDIPEPARASCNLKHSPE
jgi:hypothetical protein